MANSYFDAILPQSTGVDILNTANDAARSDRSARIAELERELAEIRKQKAQFSEEGEMGEYKFLYDADPSAYMNYRQNMRNLEQTERIAKRNEETTKQANIKTMLDNLSLKREEAYWGNKGYVNKFKYAKQANDPQAMEEALLGMQRTQGLLNKYDRDIQQLQPEIAKMVGLKDYGKEVEDKTDYSEQERDIEGAKTLSLLKRDFERTAPSIKVDNVPISKEQKAENIAKWKSDIDNWREQVTNSAFGEERKTDLLKQLDEMAANVEQYGKPSNKGGQSTIPTQAEVSALNNQQLLDKGYEWLTYIQRLGLTHPYLAKAINLSRKRKK